MIDGEAIVCDENGLAVFDLIRRHGTIASAVHCAFDLLDLDGKDLRGEPIEKRRELLAELLGGSRLNLVFNECFGEDGTIVYREERQKFRQERRRQPKTPIQRSIEEQKAKQQV